MFARVLILMMSFFASQSFARTTILVCNGILEDSKYALNLKFDHKTLKYTGVVVDKTAATEKQILVSRDLVFSNSVYQDDLRIFELVGLKIDEQKSRSAGKTIIVQDSSFRFSARGVVKFLTFGGRNIELETVCAKNQSFLDRILNSMEEEAQKAHGTDDTVFGN
jgi:hypothetical protein